MNFKDYIDEVQDFPKKGILFRDITPLIKSHLSELIDEMAKMIDASKVDYFVGIDARGFIFATALAMKFNKGVVIARKKGKLPPPTVSIAYNLEYGQEFLEMKKGSGNVIIVDDVLATGGTLTAVCELASHAGYNVKDIITVINLKNLNKFKWNEISAKSVVQY